MLGKEKAFEILSECLRYSRADETELILEGGKNFLTRFANNYIHQNVLQKDYTLTARVCLGKKVGVASCNAFFGKELKAVVLAATDIARTQREEPEYIPLPDSFDYTFADSSYDQRTADFSPEEKAWQISRIVDTCRKRGLVAYGAYSTGDHMVALLNSKGSFAYHCETLVSLTLTIMTLDGGSGWAEASSTRVDEISPQRMLEVAMEKAVGSIDSITLEPGRYTVVLEEPAVHSLVVFLCWLGLGALSFQEGKSFMTGRIGERITGENITLIDDYTHPVVCGRPFDYEAIPKKRVTLIENGIARGVVYDLKTAAREGRESTGHALPPPSVHGPLPSNVILMPGGESREGMIASTRRGILVTRFWYDNVVDPKKTIVTGMTRDGTFLIENGKVTRAIRNMRYNENVLEALSRVESISSDLKLFKEDFTIACPTLKISDFCFTGISRS